MILMNQTLQIIGSVGLILAAAINAAVTLQMSKRSEYFQIQKLTQEIYISELKTTRDKLQIILQSILKISEYYTFTSSFIDEVTKINITEYHQRYQKHLEEKNVILSIVTVYIQNNSNLTSVINEISSQMNLIWGAQMSVIQSQNKEVIMMHKSEILKYSGKLSELVNKFITEVGELAPKVNNKNIK